MSLYVRRFADLSPETLGGLNGELVSFYQHPPPAYYQTADQAARQYTPAQQPFHCDLVQRVAPGATVLELGCGTAHLCPHVEARGGIYTGMDYSEPLLGDNRARHPRARFLPLQTALAESFDVVVSLYTVEHVVDPPGYLSLMWRSCRPGGLLAIICPEFIDSPSLPPSIFYGRTPRRLRHKLRHLALADVLLHLADLKIRAPRWQAQARRTAPGAFWINLRPRILHGGQYEIDADAVHLTRGRDLAWYFTERGAASICQGSSMPGVSADILKYNTYLVARKPNA
jgi:SAM-dependent methyltransferase